MAVRAGYLSRPTLNYYFQNGTLTCVFGTIVYITVRIIAIFDRNITIISNDTSNVYKLYICIQIFIDEIKCFVFVCTL